MSWDGLLLIATHPSSITNVNLTHDNAFTGEFLCTVPRDLGTQRATNHSIERGA
jgi:hypothetical protein